MKRRNLNVYYMQNQLFEKEQQEQRTAISVISVTLQIDVYA